VGHFPGTAEHAYEADHIRHQCEQSLINLKRDYIDIYYFHHGNFGENDKYLDSAVAVMNKLKDEGLTLLEYVVEHWPKSTRGRISLASTLYQRGDAERAKQIYEELLDECANQYPENIQKTKVFEQQLNPSYQLDETQQDKLNSWFRPIWNSSNILLQINFRI